MKKIYLWVIYCKTKIVWNNSHFLREFYMQNFINHFLNSYNYTMISVKNKMDYLRLYNFSLKNIPLSHCENNNCILSDNDTLDKNTTLKENKKNNFFKLLEYEYLAIKILLYYFKCSLRFLIFTLVHFYLFFYNCFNLVLYILRKKIIYKNKQLNYYFSIPNHLFNSFVTIYKIPKRNNSFDFNFKIDDLTFLGSGFIYDKRGYVLTAAHNVTHLEEGTFIIKNCDDFYLAEVSGLHNESDVCVMKIVSKKKFPHISLDTKRETLKHGELVITFGQIQNFDRETCSIGIVNQPKQTFSKFTNFSEKEQPCLYPFIQISNPINNGMSGSPLIDQNGNLVGMIQKKIDNYGLALPINILKNIAEYLQYKGTYKEPFLGIILKEKEFNIRNSSSSKKELKIYDILSNSPAEISGLKREDVLFSINNKNIKNICEVHEILNSTSDRFIDVEILRQNKKLKFKV
ncbi:trypsin-like serine protease, putative [Plasmodium gallinaceum]|uniref:Trypsin-like serine protease, putative n=1 Tax=Plasmodium gallinaceum TaxID=5849 RepID=A0A1J1H2T6_PLAGA|nr:trypsin-like serine protease, putative [Plasmodium gallinaceum]CRG97662.1 trypsin-like serine protease, putative [Plasmodium gallinaceum]